MKGIGIKVKFVSVPLEIIRFGMSFYKSTKDSASSYCIKSDVIRYSWQNSIMFYGQVGSSKTHLAVTLNFNLLDRGLNVVYLPYRDLPTRIC